MPTMQGVSFRSNQPAAMVPVTAYAPSCAEGINKEKGDILSDFLAEIPGATEF